MVEGVTENHSTNNLSIGHHIVGEAQEELLGGPQIHEDGLVLNKTRKCCEQRGAANVVLDVVGSGTRTSKSAR